MPPKLQLVLAGNYRQFKDWCREHRKREPKDALYLFDENRLRGVNYSDVELVLTGSYTSHKLWGSPHLQYLQSEISRAAAQEALAAANAFLKRRQALERKMAKNRWESLLV